MNFSEIKSAVKHLLKTSNCLHCKAGFKEHDIRVLVTTQNEGLFDIKCSACNCSTIVTVTLSAETRTHGGISQNDVLDIKNFLSGFDGNFKKIFTNEQ